MEKQRKDQAGGDGAVEENHIGGDREAEENKEIRRIRGIDQSPEFMESRDIFVLNLVKSGQRVVFGINIFKGSHVGNQLFIGSHVGKSLFAQ